MAAPGRATQISGTTARVRNGAKAANTKRAKSNLNAMQFSLFDDPDKPKSAPQHSGAPSGGSLDGGHTHEEHLPF